MKYDFGGWATKNNLQCSDGLTIIKDAFKHNDGRKVPLIWNHEHGNPSNVLGHAMLENRDDGVYAYCVFNDTAAAQDSKNMVAHGDIVALSIYANQLQKQGNFVKHGMIREVSLVLAGANPGAFIDEVMVHGQSVSDEGVIFTGECIELTHNGGAEVIEHKEKSTEKAKVEPDTDKTIGDVFATLTDEQKEVVYALVGAAVEEEKNNNEGDDNMKQNAFNNNNKEGQNGGSVLSHSEMKAVLDDGKRYGSLKDAVIAHGVTNLDFLFPDFKTVNNVPDFIKRDTGWVEQVLKDVHKTPFSRIKSVHANITEDDARAKGYLKGSLKKEEVFSLLKRTTTPTTIYKKQKLDRDDAIDIVDFEVVSWLKMEMRMMLDEEIARCMLVGDGRLGSSDEKVNETNIRPIWKDADLYAIKAAHDLKGLSDDAAARSFIKTAVKARKNYKGSGALTLYTNEDIVTSILLMEDTTGRIIYDSVEKIKAILRVKDIITVPVMENLTRIATDAKVMALQGIFVNLTDYNLGADKGGAVAMFDDFDIDYNQQKYLIETRCSGALTLPYSAIIVESYTTV